MSYSIVGEQISKFRKEKGLTQRELGEAIGISSSAVSQWEGGGTPDISLLPAISDILGVTVDALFGRTETKRENMEEVVGKYIASLPEDERLGRLMALMRKAVLTGCVDGIADVMDFGHRDSEAAYIARDGLVTTVTLGGRSFLSAIRNPEGLFDDLLFCDESVRQLFAALARPHALTMLSNLYRETPKYRTAGALAKLTGITRDEAEEILSKFTEIHLTAELELETEAGGTKAYSVNLTGAAIPLLFSAKLITEPETSIKIISDKRHHAQSDENA